MDSGSVLCLTGASASGKTDVGIAVARALARGGAPTEVVACDAWTVYRGASVLTAKPVPPPDVPHRLLDVIEPSASYSAGRFVEDADAAIADARGRGRDALLVGGTALYLRCFLKGIGPRAPRDDDLRGRLDAIAEREGPGALWERLLATDPARAHALHRNDVRRVVRALEIAETTGRPASAFREEWDGPDRRAAVVVALRRADDDLGRRIDARSRTMVEAGVVDEVARLADAPGGVSRELRQAIGFEDALERRAGRIDDAELVARISRATRRLSRRQGTFLRGFPAIRWVDAGPVEDPVALAARVLDRAAGHPSDGAGSPPTPPGQT